MDVKYVKLGDVLLRQPRLKLLNREFNIYDVTVAKTLLKIASSSVSMSVCLTFESLSGTSQQLNLVVWCQSWVTKFKFTCSVKLEKWSFHDADLPRTGKKWTEITKKKKHVKGVQSFCFCSLNTQNLWRCRCRRVVELLPENRIHCARRIGKPPFRDHLRS